MSRFPSWHFRAMDAGEVHVDPVHDEFFKMQDLADALVRESIQNSLDARRGRAPVRVRFSFATGARALSAEAAQQYFLGLRPHIDASEILSVLPGELDPVPYLLIEDFGTRGLTGDPSIDPELEDDGAVKNDFYYFWRNVGRSSKGEVDRGRWGLGKAVFSVASRIRTIFGLTRRADDFRSLLLGQSVLKTHILDGQRMYPYGFFARFEKKSGMPLPIDDPLLLERFADDFALQRAEAGLSIVVPYYRADELSLERVITAAIAQYFYPITRGDLIVDVGDDARHETITSRSIDDVATRYLTTEAESVARLANLTRWSLTEAATERVELGEQALERAPKWHENVFDARTLERLRDRFEKGEPLAVRVPLLVKRKRSKPASSFFDVILQKDETLRKPEHHFIRRGITIPDVRSGTTSEKPVRALVVVDHEALSTFLGDAENPAHSDWSERADKLRLLYDHHAATLRHVKNSAAFLASLVSRPPEGRARDFLRDIFSIEMPEEPEGELDSAPTVDDGGNETTIRDGRPAGDASRRSAVTLARVAGGFTMRGGGEARVTRSAFVVEMAYRVRSGNPFRKHSPFDFDATDDSLSLDAADAEVRRAGANRIEVMPRSTKFHVTMKGFDARRDLVVRVVEQATDAPEAELH